MQIAAFQFLGIFIQPTVVHGEHIVGIPDLIRIVLISNQLDFIGDILR